MQTNSTTIKTENQAPIWMLDLTGELVNEPRTGKRDASGQFLFQDVPLKKAPKVQSFDKQMLAAKFNADADELFL